tara:strand:+ start:304 stop:885 length:582 start_codon:yes stop_codon:yes gene_type:complete
MQFYKEQTKRMISLLREGKSLNVLRDFFAQLSRIRPLITIAVINALEPSDVDSSKLISECVTHRDWMKKITIEDIRNHIVFLIWKEHKFIVNSNDYYDKTIDDDEYHRCISPSSTTSLLTEDIGILIETCFYIRQICVLKELIEDDFDDLSILDEPEWDMYHLWLHHSVNTHGLKQTIYENFKMIEPLIRYSD